ncbi:glucosamine inositolphosphorylceramide transferase family protein [Bacillus sp. SG-1]|uniref:glucosamine inositolphosphorylceramide transferase family protein n=1 Tax=Bacillus sp. SG-1 TaxID=161544 RepID=UPI0012E99803|nr:hypothetical protein [Bacillus sp. SG-1]
MKKIINQCSFIMKKLFWIDEWNIGIISIPVEYFLQRDFSPEIAWLPKRRKGDFIADPFVVSENSCLTILYEELAISDGRGKISALSGTWSQQTLEFQPVQTVDISNQFSKQKHLSYPYILHYENEFYCVPEMNGENGVKLFQAVRFPDQWKEVSVIIKGFKAVDPTIFHHEGYWWLFCTNQEEDPQSKLYVWFSEDLYSGWTEHLLNPVKSDVTSSRPAGKPFYKEGSLYRPSQDCSRTYGGKIVINEIVELTPTKFKEEPVIDIQPFSMTPYSKGIHTISYSGNITVIDSKRSRFFPLKVFYKWKSSGRQL